MVSTDPGAQKDTCAGELPTVGSVPTNTPSLPLKHLHTQKHKLVPEKAWSMTDSSIHRMDPNEPLHSHCGGFNPPWHFPPFKCLIEALLLRNAVELQSGHQTGSKRASNEQDGMERAFDSCWSSCPRRALAFSLEGYQRAPLLFISAECQWRPG